MVEACHLWTSRNLGILIGWSKKDEHHLALMQLASALIVFKKGSRRNTVRRGLRSEEPPVYLRAPKPSRLAVQGRGSPPAVLRSRAHVSTNELSAG